MDIGSSSTARTTEGGEADRAPPAPTSALRDQLANLEQQDLRALRAEWRHLFRSEPPQLSRDLIVRALAYRLQERVHGGHSKAALRRLSNLVQELRAEGEVKAAPRPQFRPGARLVREWRARTHTVTVLENGFEYAGTVYLSLTPIAKAITGAHWSGPRFFGLVRRRVEAVSGNVSRLAEEARHG